MISICALSSACRHPCVHCSLRHTPLLNRSPLRTSMSVRNARARPHLLLCACVFVRVYFSFAASFNTSDDAGSHVCFCAFLWSTWLSALHMYVR